MMNEVEQNCYETEPKLKNNCPYKKVLFNTVRFQSRFRQIICFILLKNDVYKNAVTATAYTRP